MRQLILCILLFTYIVFEVSCASDAEINNLVGKCECSCNDVLSDPYYVYSDPYYVYDDKLLHDLVQFKLKNIDCYEENDAYVFDFGKILLDAIYQFQYEDWRSDFSDFSDFYFELTNYDFDFSSAVCPFKCSERSIDCNYSYPKDAEKQKVDSDNISPTSAPINEDDSNQHSTLIDELITQKTVQKDISKIKNDTNSSVLNNTEKYLWIDGKKYNMKKFNITRNEDGILNFGNNKKLERLYYSDFVDIDSLTKKIFDLCVISYNSVKKAKYPYKSYNGAKVGCFRAIFKKLSNIEDDTYRQKCFDRCIKIVKESLCIRSYRTFFHFVMQCKGFSCYIKYICNSTIDHYGKYDPYQKGKILGDIVLSVILNKRLKNAEYLVSLTNIMDIKILGNSFVYWCLYYYFCEVDINCKLSYYRDFNSNFTKIMDWLMMQDKYKKDQLSNEINYFFVEKDETVLFLNSAKKEKQVIEILSLYDIDISSIIQQMPTEQQTLKRLLVCASESSDEKRIAL